MALSSTRPADDGGGPPPSSWRGVNLGGWLVLERWMSPELFENLVPEAGDEASLLRWGGEEAQEAVTQFRDEFITEEDFKWLRDVGEVNAVRLPLGYWCMEEHARGTPYMPTSHYVDAVFDWAEAYGIRVLLDLHGACGSQNAQHHSGTIGGQPRWLQADNREVNLEVLQSWAQRWGQRKAFLGLGLGNEVAEPKATSFREKLVGTSPAWLEAWLLGECCQEIAPTRSYWDEVADFYADAAALCRPYLHADAPLVIDTCWDAGRWGDRLSQIPGPLVLDYHHYECFGESSSVAEHCQAEALRRTLLQGEQDSHQMIIGEFSLALRPDSLGYADGGWQSGFFEQQGSIAAERGAGWFFWSYKMAREGWSEWSFRESVELGWIPRASSGKKEAPSEVLAMSLPRLLTSQCRRSPLPAALVGPSAAKAFKVLSAPHCMNYDRTLLVYPGSPISKDRASRHPGSPILAYGK